MNISVNKKAPVYSSFEVNICATIEKVWETLTDIKKWPDWQASVTEVKLDEDINEHTKFLWKADGITFKSEIHTLKLKSMIGWTGKTVGINAIHNWTLIEQDNFTIVLVEECLQGVLAVLFKRYFQKSLNKGMLKNLNELKVASELK